MEQEKAGGYFLCKYFVLFQYSILYVKIFSHYFKTIISELYLRSKDSLLSVFCQLDEGTAWI